MAAEVGDGATVEFDEAVGGHPEALGQLAEAAVFAIVLDDDPALPGSQAGQITLQVGQFLPVDQLGGKIMVVGEVSSSEKLSSSPGGVSRETRL